MPKPIVGIIGLGLIGGSIARDLAARGTRVLGFDCDSETLQAATASGIVAGALGSDLAGSAGTDTIVLAVPVSALTPMLARLRPHLRPHTLVTDVASTKRSAEAAAATAGLGAQFVGCHPLAGDHRGGWAASRAGLFRDAPVYLCPGPETPVELLERARQFWVELAARPVLTTAAAHDRLLAHTSHLPQATAFLLARVLARAGVHRTDLGPGGRDTLRLAASPPDLWSEITADNAEFLAPALERLGTDLAALAEALRSRDERELAAAFREGRDWFVADS